jgi:hypothetical protein
MRARNYTFVSIMTLILAGAAFLRIWGIDWGLPQEFQPDEPLIVPRAIGIVTHGDWNPHYFLVPSLQTGLTGAAYKLVYAGGRLAGSFRSPDDFGQWAAWHYDILYLIGRGISVLFGLIAVVGTAFLTREIICEYRKHCAGGLSRDYPLWGQALAALLVGVNSLAVTSSRLITPDIPMLAFFAWGLWALLKASSLSKPVGTDSRTSSAQKWLVLAGFLGGLAVSSKYSAAVILLPLIVGAVQIRRNEKTGGIAGILFVPLAVFLVGFLVGTPYALFDLPTFLDHLKIQYAAQHEGHIGMEQAGATILRILYDLVFKCGPILLPVALAGIAVGWLKARRSWWLIVPVLVVYIAEVSRWRVYADRYLLPALPILAALSGLALTALAYRIKSPILRTTTGFLFIAILVVPPLIIDIQQTRNLLLPDTRTSALEWVERNIPSGAKILLEIGGPQPADLNAEYHRDPSFDIAILPPGFSEISQGIDPSSALDIFQPDYVITSSNYRARYGDAYARRRFPRVVAAWEIYYSRLDTSWDLVYEIKPQSTPDLKTVGPDIWIYHRRNGL